MNDRKSIKQLQPTSEQWTIFAEQMTWIVKEYMTYLREAKTPPFDLAKALELGNNKQLQQQPTRYDVEDTISYINQHIKNYCETYGIVMPKFINY